MAVYRFSAKVIGRSSGRSATAAAAYRAAERIVDQRTGLAHDYRRRGGVEYKEILTPDDAPEWMRDRAALWNAVERIEKRKDAQLVREIQLSLPHELEAWQRAELVREFIRDQFVAHGMIADIAIHTPDRQGDQRNHHAHVLLTMRELTGAGFGKKQRGWNDTERLQDWREQWAAYQNRALERAGSKERVDHRSYEERGIDQEPEPKVGPHATEMERRGQASERGDERRRVWARNQLREELKREARVIDLAIEREKRRLQKEARAAERAQAEQYRRAAGSKEPAGRAGADREPEARVINLARERAAARQKGRFEEWANRKRAELQSDQLDRRGELGRRHGRQRDALNDALAEAYGPGIRKDEKTLAEIAARQEAGRLSRFVYRLSGQARRDEVEAAAARAGLADAGRRMGEQRGRLERAQAAERWALDTDLLRESRELEGRIQAAYERRERDGWRDDRPAANDRQAAEQERGRAEDSGSRRGAAEQGPERDRGYER